MQHAQNLRRNPANENTSHLDLAGCVASHALRDGSSGLGQPVVLHTRPPAPTKNGSGMWMLPQPAPTHPVPNCCCIGTATPSTSCRQSAELATCTSMPNTHLTAVSQLDGAWLQAVQLVQRAAAEGTIGEAVRHQRRGSFGPHSQLAASSDAERGQRHLAVWLQAHLTGRYAMKWNASPFSSSCSCNQVRQGIGLLACAPRKLPRSALSWQSARSPTHCIYKVAAQATPNQAACPPRAQWAAAARRSCAQIGCTRCCRWPGLCGGSTTKSYTLRRVSSMQCDVPQQPQCSARTRVGTAAPSHPPAPPAPKPLTLHLRREPGGEVAQLRQLRPNVQLRPVHEHVHNGLRRARIVDDLRRVGRGALRRMGSVRHTGTER